MSFANTHSPVAITSKNAHRADNNRINSRWVFASPNAQDAKTHRPTLSLRWSKPDTL